MYTLYLCQGYTKTHRRLPHLVLRLSRDNMLQITISVPFDEDFTRFLKCMKT